MFTFRIFGTPIFVALNRQSMSDPLLINNKKITNEFLFRNRYNPPTYIFSFKIHQIPVFCYNKKTLKTISPTTVLYFQISAKYFVCFVRNNKNINLPKMFNHVRQTCVIPPEYHADLTILCRQRTLQSIK
jgi:hypothetical protein